MKKTFLVAAIASCSLVVSAQSDSNIAGEYTVKENCWLGSHFTTTSEYTRNYKIDANPDDNELLSVTIGWADYTGKSLGDNFFTIIDTNMYSFGVVVRDSFYLYYNKTYSESVYGECICIGSRKTKADSSQANVKKTSAQYQNRINKPLYSDPELLAQAKPNFAGEYIITSFSKELTEKHKSSEYETSIVIASDGKKSPILKGIVGQLEMTLDGNYFFIRKHYFDSTDISVGGFGLLKNDSIYLYYYENGKSDTTNSIGVGTRKKTTVTGFSSMPAVIKAVLYQNSPNPFSNQTEIKYNLPENAENAAINVYSLNGNMLLSKPITQTGNGSITINGNELEAGTYIYTLSVDGVEVDSKRMVVVK